MIDFDFCTPQTTHELAAMLENSGARILAGGTDVIPRLRRGQFSAASLVDISRINDLRFIREVDGEIQIGALTTHADLLASPLIQENAPALAQAAATVGCPQTRQRGTLGGNLANASPAADSAPPLLALKASAHLASSAGSAGNRAVPLQEFFLGPGKTVLAPGDFIESITFQRPQGSWGSAFFKLGKRSGMAISIVSAAVYLELEPHGSLREIRLGLGSAAPTPVRSLSVEQCLAGQIPSAGRIREASHRVLEDISPIADLRASAEYRRHAAEVAVRRVVETALQQAYRRQA